MISINSEIRKVENSLEKYKSLKIKTGLDMLKAKLQTLKEVKELIENKDKRLAKDDIRHIEFLDILGEE